MGFNSTRRYRDGKVTDIALLIAGLVILGLLTLWGFGVL